MKKIKLKYLGIGRRTVNLHMSGFMGPAKSPLGKGPLKVGEDYLRPGTLTSAYRLMIPPNGECEVVDCQANRERLRKATTPYKKWEEVKVYDEDSGKYVNERKQVTITPAFKVMDDTPIDEDVVSDNPLGDTKEVQVLKAKISAMEEKNGVKSKKEKTPSKPAPNATPSGEVELEVEEFEDNRTAKQRAADLKKSRFASKSAPANPTPIT